MMKPFLKYLVLVPVLLVSLVLKAQNNYVVSNNEMKIEGTSNVHDWEENVNAAIGNAVIIWNADGSITISTMVIEINCKSIKSTHGSIMDSKTYEALKADQFPVITFNLNNALNNIKPTPTGIMVIARGLITIAGITKSIDLQVKVSSQDFSTIRIEGSKSIKMTDYGVSPPTAFMGAMKVGDDVIINFNTNVQKKN